MDEYMSEPRVWGRICGGSVEEIPRARQWTREILRDHPCLAELVRDVWRSLASTGPGG